MHTDLGFVQERAISGPHTHKHVGTARPHAVRLVDRRHARDLCAYYVTPQHDHMRARVTFFSCASKCAVTSPDVASTMCIEPSVIATL
jgi:hypothetical protein